MATTRMQVHWAVGVSVERKTFGDFYTATILIETADGDLVEVELFSNKELPRIEDIAPAAIADHQEAA